MDFEQYLKEFENYIKKFDLNIEELKYKYDHTLRVVDYTKIICKSENISKEDTNLALISALLHDIARFEEWTKYRSWSKIDHGDLGYEILSENNCILKFVGEDKEQIVLNVVKYHNKLEIPDFLNKQEKKILKIVRDADKIDIMLTQGNENYLNEKDIIVPKQILDLIINEKMIEYNQITNYGILILNHLSFLFDMNYRSSFKIIYSLGIINKKLEILRVILKDRKEYKIIEMKINDYLESNIKL